MLWFQLLWGRLTITNDIILSKILSVSIYLQRNGFTTIAVRYQKQNASWSVVIKKRYIRHITLNPWNAWHFLFSPYIWNSTVFPQTLDLWFYIVNHCAYLKDINISSLWFSWQVFQIFQTILQSCETNNNCQILDYFWYHEQ